MEEAPGTQPSEVWNAMKISDKTKVAEGFVEIKKKLLSVSFTKYGSIYVATDAFEGCAAAKLVGDISPDLKRGVEEHFTIRPLANREFWNEERASLAINRGPWKKLHDYLDAIGRREIAWLSRHAIPKPPKDIFIASEAQNSPDAHTALYESFLSIVPYLLLEENFTGSTLWHWDIYLSNLFVDGNRITCLIDWQETWAGPLFPQYRHPKLVDYNGQVLLRLPEGDEGIEDADEMARVRMQVESSIVLHRY